MSRPDGSETNAKSSPGDFAAVAGVLSPVIAFVVVTVYNLLNPPDPRAHWGAAAYRSKDIGTSILVLGAIVAVFGAISGKKRQMRTLALFAACLYFLLAALSTLILF